MWSKRTFWRDRTSDVIIGITSTVLKTVKITSTFKVTNFDILIKSIEKRPKGIGLLTVTNHVSTIDDPVIWSAILPPRIMWNSKKVRWGQGAKEILFTNPFFNWYFGAGQVIPIVRGAGLEQPGVLFSIEKLNDGEWVHTFPEGKINQSGTLIPFRWGVGKLVADSQVPPIVLPVYHTGFEKMMPGPPYIPRMFGKTIEVLVGDQIDFTEILKNHETLKSPKPEIYKDITSRIEAEMRKLENTMKERQKRNAL